MNEKQLICVAHRGARGYEPENTLRAFAKAIDLGAPWIELDVYPIEDELMIIHDLRLDRTTNGSGFVFEKSKKHLRSLDAGQGEKIPFLREVLELVDRKAGINIELKWKGTAEPVARAIQAAIKNLGWSPDQFLVSSFIHAELVTFAKLMPGIRIGALTGELPVDYAAFAQKLGAWSLHPTIEFIDQEFVDDAHDRGLKVFVYTVNHPEELAWMVKLGVDGVFTDYPDRIIAAQRD
jgi:glycerophosphoryl diester phosphodiesterase